MASGSPFSESGEAPLAPEMSLLVPLRMAQAPSQGGTFSDTTSTQRFSFAEHRDVLCSHQFLQGSPGNWARRAWLSQFAGRETESQEKGNDCLSIVLKGLESINMF